MTQDAVIKALRDAADLIEQPNAWAVRTFAKDRFGNLEHPCSPYAVCWSADGALLKVARNDVALSAIKACHDTLVSKGKLFTDLQQFNDFQAGPETVVALMRETADRLEKGV